MRRKKKRRRRKCAPATLQPPPSPPREGQQERREPPKKTQVREASEKRSQTIRSARRKLVCRLSCVALLVAISTAPQISGADNSLAQPDCGSRGDAETRDELISATSRQVPAAAATASKQIRMAAALSSQADGPRRRQTRELASRKLVVTSTRRATAEFPPLPPPPPPPATSSRPDSDGDELKRVAQRSGKCSFVGVRLLLIAAGLARDSCARRGVAKALGALRWPSDARSDFLVARGGATAVAVTVATAAAATIGVVAQAKQLPRQGTAKTARDVD